MNILHHMVMPIPIQGNHIKANDVSNEDIHLTKQGHKRF